MSFAGISFEVFSVWHAGFSGQELWGRGPHASRLAESSFGIFPPSRSKAVGLNGERAEARIPRGPPAGEVVEVKAL